MSDRPTDNELRKMGFENMEELEWSLASHGFENMEEIEKAGFSSLRNMESYLASYGFETMKEMKEWANKETIEENEQEEKEEQFKQEIVAFMGGSKPFNEQDQKILQQFSNREQQIMEKHIRTGFGEDFSKYIDSALEVPIKQFYKEFIKADNKKVSELPRHRLEKYIQDFQKDIPLIESPEEKLLLFGKFMGLEGSEDTIVTKMKQFEILQKNQISYVPLEKIYYESVSTVLRSKIEKDSPDLSVIDWIIETEKRKPYFQKIAENIVDMVNRIKKEQHMEEKKRIPYYKQNIEKVYNAVETGTAPFMVGKEKEGKILINALPVVRAAVNGKVFKDLNQLVAQINLAEMGKSDNALITFEQANEAGTGIRRGSKSIILTTYDRTAAEGNKSKVYNFFPVSSVANINKVVGLEGMNKSEYSHNSILCTESSPEKYLGRYLAASNLGAQFETTADTISAFKKNFLTEMGQNIANNKHTAMFDICSKANEECKNTMRGIAQDRGIAQEKNVKNTYKRDTSPSMDM